VLLLVVLLLNALIALLGRWHGAAADMAPLARAAA
jgi:hypothetical protein